MPKIKSNRIKTQNQKRFKGWCDKCDANIIESYGRQSKCRCGFKMKWHPGKSRVKEQSIEYDLDD